MKLEVEHLPRIAVINVTEGLVGGESEKLIAVLKKVLEDGTRRFIIDLSESGDIDSGGIGSLMKALPVVAEQGGRIESVMPSTFFESLSVLHHPYNPIIGVHRSREQAIDALLDLEIDAERIEAEAQRIYGDIESLRRRSTARLRFAIGIFLISGLILLVVWLT